jgi:uncharacterized membrane protein (DUF2068 family)
MGAGPDCHRRDHPPDVASNTVRAVALFEAFKGTLVVLVGLGALSLVHHDAQRIAEELVGHLHLNPAKHYPRIFIDTAAHLTDARLWVLAALAATYGLVRFVEAYGLWQGKRWAEWLAAVSAGIYIPFELYGLFEGDIWFSFAALVINVFIVGLMVSALLRKHRVEANAV